MSLSTRRNSKTKSKNENTKSYWMNPSRAYPFSKISEKSRDDNFRYLQRVKFKKGDIIPRVYKGNGASNYYFQKYRVKTKCRGARTRWDAWKDLTMREKILKGTLRLNRNKTPNILLASRIRGYINMRFGSVSQFKPVAAVYVFQKFKPKRVLDITAGWGDRLVGAMTQNIDYIGIDSNLSLETPYSRMIKEYQKKSTSNILMIFDKAQNVDYKKLPKYDLIFTSPPYFNIEQYEHMSILERTDFIDKFFIPTIQKSWNAMEINGVLALNMPVEMMLIIKPLLGSPKKIKYPIQNRFRWRGDSDDKHECIFWWKKK
jgi:DNA modification methylase